MINSRNLSRLEIKEKQVRLFMKKVDKPDTCQLWLGCKNQKGYGYFRVNGQIHLAHRVSYAITYGEVPSGVLVRHTCHIRSCVNPAHLILGTHAENMQDMVRAGRQHRRGVSASRHVAVHVVQLSNGYSKSGHNVPHHAMEDVESESTIEPIARGSTSGRSR